MLRTKLKLSIIVIPVILLIGWVSIHFGFDWRQFIHANSILGKSLFCLCMVLLPMGGFSINAFYIFAGLAFPPYLGFGLCVISLAINMTISYWIAHSWLRNPINGFLEKRGIHKLQFAKKNAFKVTFYARALPVLPFFMQNYLLGASAIPFLLYISLSLLIQSLFAAGTIYLVVKSIKLNIWQLVAAIVAIVIIVAISRYILKKVMKKDELIPKTG